MKLWTRYILFVLLILVTASAVQAQRNRRYSIDKEPTTGATINIPEFLRKKSEQEKADNKKAREERKNDRIYKKTVKKRLKKLNSEDQVQTRDANYKKMRQTLKGSERMKKGKSRTPWYKRKFWKRKKE